MPFHKISANQTPYLSSIARGHWRIFPVGKPCLGRDSQQHRPAGLLGCPGPLCTRGYETPRYSLRPSSSPTAFGPGPTASSPWSPRLVQAVQELHEQYHRWDRDELMVLLLLMGYVSPPTLRHHGSPSAGLQLAFTVVDKRIGGGIRGYCSRNRNCPRSSGLPDVKVVPFRVPQCLARKANLFIGRRRPLHRN